MKGKIKTSTERQYRCEITKLKLFKQNLNFSDINYNFIQLYEQYMRNTLNNKTNTVNKTFKKFKRIIKLAIYKEKIKHNPFEKYVNKKAVAHREFLYLNELDNLKEFLKSNKLKEYQKNVLQYFLFCCYTGLRYEDIKDLKFSDIIELESGEKIIIVKQHKTEERVSVPLKNNALELMPKDYTYKEQKIFKVACNQVVNRQLKDIFKIAKIEKKLTFHCSRHTFATNALTLGIPIEVVSSMLGHTYIKTTEIYAKVIDALKIKEMNKFN